MSEEFKLGAAPRIPPSVGIGAAKASAHPSVASEPGPHDPQPGDQSQLAATLAVPRERPLPPLPGVPPRDIGKTWGGPDSPRDLNFGHHPALDGHGQRALIDQRSDGLPLWADSHTAVTPDQWVLMPAAQQAKLLAMLPPERQASFRATMDRGDASAARVKRPPTLAAGDEAMLEHLRLAAEASTQRHRNVPGACCQTAKDTAAGLGGDLLAGKNIFASRGQSLEHMGQDIKAGVLTPGMAIYMDTHPGTDDASVNMANHPHWMTYLGPDTKGVPRFADQYDARWSLSDLSAAYGRTRIIDCYVDCHDKLGN